jgi:GTP-binding protein HflX
MSGGGGFETEAPATRTLVVYPHLKGAADAARLPEARLGEAAGLARAINLDVVASEVVTLAKRRPSTLLGEGTVLRLKGVIAQDEIGLAVLDAALTPVQQRNLERAWDCKVIDRTGLILEIFGARARTREGALQVELASLSYQKSRLVRSWTHLERQRGGFGFLGGPGETQIETDRRLIGERIAKLKKELGEVRRTRDLHRRARKRVPFPVVALVGYTNAGKSTLFNHLTKSEVFAQDLLFATLDPTMRAMRLPSGRTVILSDTVGFVSDLPHELVAAFRATLEEVREAEIIVHVRDVAHPDTRAQKQDVEGVLKEIGLEAPVEAGLIEALNKIDLLPEAEREHFHTVASRSPQLVALSALTGEGCPVLLDRLDAALSAGLFSVIVEMPVEDGATLAWLHAHGEVLERQDGEARMRLSVRLDAANLSRLRQREGVLVHG